MLHCDAGFVVLAGVFFAFWRRAGHMCARGVEPGGGGFHQGNEDEDALKRREVGL